ncbi:hypothetical protein [Acidaminococcus timonensis]|uniref:hypothetical protein n=1 Tax=Acidaminococcus timonensis TaxID=1871002 RepID=UPI0025E9B6FE|nr:hypothetical protein [Acidaminococcus timonensis]MDD6570709.1 hypothetical protein [Acidaminococcus sp.]
MYDWDDVEEIIFTGSAKEVENLKCPECGGHLIVRFYRETMSMEVKCEKCGSMSRSCGCFEVPRYLEKKHK